MALLINLLAVLVGFYSVAQQAVAWWHFQSFISRTPAVRRANQSSFFTGMLLLITLLVIILQQPRQLSLITVVVIVASIAEILAARWIRDDMKNTKEVIDRELAAVERMRARLLVMQRN